MGAGIVSDHSRPETIPVALWEEECVRMGVVVEEGMGAGIVSDHSRPETIPVDRDGLRSGVVGHSGHIRFLLFSCMHSRDPEVAPPYHADSLLPS